MLKSVYNLLSMAYDWFSIHALIYYGCKWIVFVFNKKTKFFNKSYDMFYRWFLKNLKKKE